MVDINISAEEVRVQLEGAFSDEVEVLERFDADDYKGVSELLAPYTYGWAHGYSASQVRAVLEVTPEMVLMAIDNPGSERGMFVRALVRKFSVAKGVAWWLDYHAKKPRVKIT